MQAQRIFLSAILICLLSSFAGSTKSPDSKKPDYQIGDRLPQQSSDANSLYKQVNWNDLLPKGWNPASEFKKLDYSKMKDSDPRAQRALQLLRETWRSAPSEPSMNGARIRIAGFIVPLEQTHHQITEFLLVPFFGGCIHVPPPPPNQIIHVTPEKPVENEQTMSAVWIGGVLETIPSDSNLGNSSYRMKAEMVEPYKY